MSRDAERKSLFFSRLQIFCLSVGFVFLLNPVIVLVDPLPDFVGYVLIAFSLSKVKYLDGYIETAASKITLLAVFSGAKTVCGLFVPGMNYSDSLAFSFLFGVFEVIFALSFVTGLFKGISYLADRNDSDGLLSKVGNARFMAVLGVVSRTVLTVAPQLFALPMLLVANGEVDWDISTRELASFYNFAIITSVFVNLIAMIWVCKEIISFFVMMGKDKIFSSRLSEKYKGFIERNPLIEEFSKFRTALYLTVVGFVFFFDLKVDNIHILPLFAGTLVFILPLYLLLPRKKFYKEASVFALLALLQFAGMRVIDLVQLPAIAVAFAELAISALFLVSVAKMEKIFTLHADKLMGCVVGNGFEPCHMIFSLACVAFFTYTLTNYGTWHSVGVLLKGAWLALELRVVFALAAAMDEQKRL